MRTAALALLAMLLLASCTVGDNAPASGGNFEFVAPDGKTEIFYPESERQDLPPLTGDSLFDEGTEISTDDFAGQVLLINVWGTWCGPCRSEVPELESLYRKTKDDGVTVLGIDVRDDRGAAQDFLRDRGVTYPSIFDNAGRSLLPLKGYPRNAVPSTILLDRQHRVAAVYLTEQLESDLMPKVRELAADPAPEDQR
ncbi:thiol-disulfide isomerase/thioredoxin [Tamaricihabitans halophyticus]|uniref:Thiol-disulfide isomerase/thioredoxin n=1 Tax=Tamaricihabitans halophyticus TaxID=1262583 RepID=A0A4R2QV16_9PSEU|nr:TlpA disulfide reductase family protein [Tamaricihabitans halophyticus]TCP53114.1 thiol-disulfide isomerase/thioredoxin [Tamaricihabitans halophyticus]